MLSKTIAKRLHSATTSPTGQVLFSGYASQALSIISGVMFARGLTPEARGHLAVYVSAISVAAVIISSGSGEAVVIATRMSHQTPRPIDLAKSLGYLRIPLSALIISIATISVLVPEDGIVLCASTYLALNMMTSVSLGFVLGAGNVLAYSFGRVFNMFAVVFVTSSVLVIGGLTLHRAMWVYSVSEAMTVFLCLILVFSTGGLHSGNSEQSSRPARFERYATLASLIAAISQSYDRVLIFIVSGYGAVFAGNTAVALSTLAPITVAGASLAPLHLASAAGREEQFNPTPRGRLTRLGVVAGIFLVAYFIALPRLIGLIFGTAYAPAFHIALLLAPGTMAFAWARPLSARLRGLGRARRVIVHETAAMALLLGLGGAGVILGVHVPLALLWGAPCGLVLGLHLLLLRSRT